MFQGTGTAIVTPFTNELEIDYAALRNIVNEQVNAGIACLVVLGTTGEAPVISDTEREKILSTVLEENNGRAKVILGTGSNDTVKTAALNKMAERIGADGVLVVNPYYNKSTQAGLVEHYRYLCDKTNLPVMLYNVPSRTAMNMHPETVIKIHEQCPNVFAVKEACGDISQIARLMAMKPETLTVYSGNDDQTVAMMALGAAGVVSVFSNVYPAVMVKLSEAMLQGNIKEALKIQNKYLSFMNLLFIETSPMPVKFACSYRGLCRNTVRLPLIPVSAATEQLLRNEMDLLQGVL